MHSPKFYQYSTILLLLIIAFLGAKALISNDENSNSLAEEFAAPDIGATKPIPVHVAPASKQELVLSISTSGRTRAQRHVSIKSRIEGIVSSVQKQEGQACSKGERIVQIDTTDYALQFRQAEQELTAASIKYGAQLGERSFSTTEVDTENLLIDPQQAEKDFLAAQSAYAKGELTKQHLQFAEYKLKAAKIFTEVDKKTITALSTGLSTALIKTEQARQNLLHTNIIAPFSGIVGDVKVQPHQFINAGEVLFTLVDLSAIYLDAEILENETALVQAGNKATARFTAFPGETFPGKVVALNPLIDIEKKTRRVTVRIENPHHKIIAGMYAQVELEAETLQDRLIVPKEAIVLRDNRPVVFIARENANGELRAVWSYIELGQQNDRYAEVLSSKFNLQPGEPVIIDNHYTMIHDARIEILGD